MSNGCCPTDKPPQEVAYTPKGHLTYEVGSTTSKNAIIYIYDIFGFTPQAYEVADLIAQSTGARVVAPDFFQGAPCSVERFGKPGLIDWIHSKGDWETVVKPLVAATSARLKAGGYKNISAIGFCWGAKMAVQALHDGYVNAVAGPHPSFLKESDFSHGFKGPVCLLPSKDESKFDGIERAILSDPKFGKASIVHHFPKMGHGFMAARANLNVPEERQAMLEGVKIVSNFFKSVWSD